MAPPHNWTPRAERGFRLFFGAVVTPCFTGLTLLFMKMRASPVRLRPTNAPPEIVIVAVIILLASIAAYGLDQFLSGVWPGRRRWFAPAEEVLEERLGHVHGRGNLTVAHVWGAPIRVHWSLPIGLILIGGPRPGAWVGFLAVVLAHELGHALLVRRFRQHVIELSFHAVGGECRWIGRPTARQRTIIAWGGVAGQAILLGIAWGIMRVAPQIFRGWFGEPLGTMLVSSNAVMAGLNLLPIRPLDGAEAWKLLFWRARDSKVQREDTVGSLVESVLDDVKRGDK
jgi:hypothetical protein